MNSRFSFNSRVTEKLNHTLALTALSDDSAVDAVWAELKKDVYDEAYAVGGLSTMHFCCVPASVERTPLEATYRAGFKDAVVHRRMERRDNAALLGAPLKTFTLAVAS